MTESPRDMRHFLVDWIEKIKSWKNWEAEWRILVVVVELYRDLCLLYCSTFHADQFKSPILWIWVGMMACTVYMHT